jgi:hypothetical protein
MFQQFYADNPLLFWPLVGLVIFLVSFAGAMLYVFFGLRDPQKVDRLARLPLEPDGAVNARSGDVPVAGGNS